MTIPTIEARRQRKFILMSADRQLIAALQAALPEGWQMAQALDLNQLGGFQDILLHRFILLDLEGGGAFDSIEAIRQVRMKLMLNVPIFCFGGSPELRDEARLARADRFFERNEIIGAMQRYCEQYRWGEC